MNNRLLVYGALLGLFPIRTFAQQLLWEIAISRPSPAGGTGFVCVLPQGNRLLVTGDYFLPRTAGCQPPLQAYARVYTMGGTLVREQLGRGLQNGESNLVAAAGGGGWWAGRGYRCPAGATTPLQRPFVQRLTAAGDTLPGWWLAPATPRATVTATLLQGNRLLTAGMVTPATTPPQGQQVTLTCSDTLGRVRWSRAYPRPPAGMDYASDLVATPRGGYLLSGDAFVGTGYRHYLVETDSGGQLRRQVLLLPLGPAVSGGSRYPYKCNVLALPNAQGYLLSGTADSLGAGQLPPGKQLGYVMRLDTALRVQWVYRHPPALGGTGARSNEAWRIRLLPNNTVGLLLTEVRSTGTPTAHLAQLDVATGQRVGFYLLNSNSQATILPYDWQWVGDGTLLLCAKSSQVGVTGTQGYLARWDFRGTPLVTGTRTARHVLRNALALFPNPATAALTVGLPGTGGAQPATLALFDRLGRCVLTRPATLGGAATAVLDVRGVPAGLYAVRVYTAAADYTGRVVVE